MALPDPLQNTEKLFAQNELVNIVEDLILKLPDKYKEVLYLCYYNEMPYAQIAKLLDITEANARQIARRARKLLEGKLTAKKLPGQEFDERGIQYE